MVVALVRVVSLLVDERPRVQVQVRGADVTLDLGVDHGEIQSPAAG